MSARRRRPALLDAPTRARVEAHVAAYQAFYGGHGARFASDEESEANRLEAQRIIDADRAAYAGPLKARQAELVEKRDVQRMPYERIARYEKLDEDEVRACLGVAGSWHDPYAEPAAGVDLAHRDPEAWHWSRTERFWQPDPNVALMRFAEAICPEAVAMVRQRVRFGALWSREIERREFGLEDPAP